MYCYINTTDGASTHRIDIYFVVQTPFRDVLLSFFHEVTEALVMVIFLSLWRGTQDVWHVN